MVKFRTKMTGKGVNATNILIIAKLKKSPDSLETFFVVKPLKPLW